MLQNLKKMLTSHGYRWVFHLSGDTPNMLEVARKGRMNYFYTFGGKDEGSQDLVQGITAGDWGLEESLWARDFVRDGNF